MSENCLTLYIPNSCFSIVHENQLHINVVCNEELFLTRFVKPRKSNVSACEDMNIFLEEADDNNLNINKGSNGD